MTEDRKPKEVTVTRTLKRPESAEQLIDRLMKLGQEGKLDKETIQAEIEKGFIDAIVFNIKINPEYNRLMQEILVGKPTTNMPKIEGIVNKCKNC